MELSAIPLDASIFDELEQLQKNRVNTCPVFVCPTATI
jgi:hypothetical protein